MVLHLRLWQRTQVYAALAGRCARRLSKGLAAHALACARHAGGDLYRLVFRHTDGLFDGGHHGQNQPCPQNALSADCHQPNHSHHRHRAAARYLAGLSNAAQDYSDCAGRVLSDSHQPAGGLCVGGRGHGQPDADNGRVRYTDNLFAIVFLSLFTCVGLYLCVYTPYKRNKRNLYCDTIKGVLVDFYRDRSRRGSTSYMPIYEYTYDGEKKKLRGQVGGTNKKYRQKGRIVTLAVDRETKKAYCIEDEKGIVIIGWIVVAFTQAIVMMLISTM